MTGESLSRLLQVATDEINRLRAENSAMRTVLAKSPIPCVYCGLDDMSRCERGFPGCARADDIICGEDEAFKQVLAERNALRGDSNG